MTETELGQELAQDPSLKGVAFLVACLVACLAACLVACLAAFLAAYLVAFLIACLAAFLVAFLVACLVAYPVNILAASLDLAACFAPAAFQASPAIVAYLAAFLVVFPVACFVAFLVACPVAGLVAEDFGLRKVVVVLGQMTGILEDLFGIGSLEALERMAVEDPLEIAAFPDLEVN